MGVIQFRVERPDLLIAASGLSLIDFLMYDGRITPAKVSLEGNILRCERLLSESGQMRLLWPRFDGTCQVVQTTSLREQILPYYLELELARGQLSRLRNQFYAWTGAGLQSSTQLDHLIQDAHRSFRSAVLRTETPETSTAAALLSMEASARASDLLCSHYTEQRIGYRRHRSPRLPVFLGCHLNGVPRNPAQFLCAFNAIQVDTRWDQLEHSDGEYTWDRLDALVAWGLEQRLFMMGGPLLDLSQNTMPAWLKSWTGDLVNLQSIISDFVETVVGRYVGRLRHWEVVAGPNRGGVAELDEEQRLNLVARVVEAARQVDEHTQISLRIVEPWGEYLSSTKNRLSPLQFVDTLRRCGVRLAEVNLELKVTETPAPVLHRDCLSLSQMIDHWSLLQIPINLMISLPKMKFRGHSHAPLPEFQAQWLRQVLLMCLSKERVTGIYCDGWAVDSADSNTDLISHSGQPTPALQVLHELCGEYCS